MAQRILAVGVCPVNYESPIRVGFEKPIDFDTFNKEWLLACLQATESWNHCRTDPFLFIYLFCQKMEDCDQFLLPISFLFFHRGWFN